MPFVVESTYSRLPASTERTSGPLPAEMDRIEFTMANRHFLEMAYAMERGNIRFLSVPLTESK